MKIHSVNSFRFCPFCGTELEREEINVGNKKNLEVRCPDEHGVLYL